MKICILMGSPRKHGNTQALLEPFSAELQNKNIDYETIWLYDKNCRLHSLSYLLGLHGAKK